MWPDMGCLPDELPTMWSDMEREKEAVPQVMRQYAWSTELTATGQGLDSIFSCLICYFTHTHMEHPETE